MMAILTLLIVAGLFVHFLPSIIASYRHCRKRHGIYVINLFLGWTGIGWIAALAWAVSDDRGESESSQPFVLAILIVGVAVESLLLFARVQ